VVGSEKLLKNGMTSPNKCYYYQLRKDVTAGNVEKNISIYITASRLNSKVYLFSSRLSGTRYIKSHDE